MSDQYLLCQKELYINLHLKLPVNKNLLISLVFTVIITNTANMYKKTLFINKLLLTKITEWISIPLSRGRGIHKQCLSEIHYGFV